MNRIRPSRGPWLRAVLIGLLCLAGSAQASDPAVLNLDQAVTLALRNQPQMERLAARIHEAEANATAEGELPDPRLTLGLANLPVDSLALTREDMTQAMVGISQMIPGGRKRQLASQRMRVEASRTGAELEAARRRIARDAAQSWLNLYYPTQALGLLERIDREYEREVDWATVALASGDMSQADTLALRMMRASFQDQIADMRREEARARAELQRWTGTVTVGTRAEGKLPEAPSLDGSRAPQALEGHPELALLRRGVDLARSEADLAREAYKPDWEVEVAYGLRGGGRTDMLSVQVGVELPLFPRNRQDRRLASRLAAVDGATQEVEDRRRELAAGLAAARAEWEAANQRIAHFETAILPLAQRRVESTLAAYRTGKSPYSAVLEARRADLDARMQLLRQQVARARAAIDLRYYLDDMTGTDRPAVPTEPRMAP